MVATTLSAICGIPGGIFSPSLSIGAGFGANLAALLPQIDPGTIVLLFMVSYLAGVVQAPITPFVIVFEMTSGHNMILPLMAASMLAFATSRLICPTPLSHGLEIGRASCRERVGQHVSVSVVAVSLKKTNNT